MAAYSVLLGCFMALLILLYTISSVARYYIKFTFFVIGSLIAATVPLPLMCLKPRNPDNALFPAWGCRQIAKLMGLSWEVRGVENIDNSKGAVVVMNHQSSLDLIVLAILWPLMKRSTVVSKRALFYLWPFGLATWMWGTVFIDRRDKHQAQNVLNKQVQVIMKKKAKLLLFAEGTRHSSDKLLPFKKGAFHIALDAKCSIQPVVVSRYYYLDSKKPNFSSGRFIVSILPVISTDGLTKNDITALVDDCYAKMQEKYTEVSSEVMLTEGNNNLASYKPHM